MPYVEFLPDGDGSPASWTPVPSGMKRFEVVQDAYNDTDADHIRSQTVGAVNLVTGHAVPRGQPVASVAFLTYLVRASTTGIARLAVRIYSGAAFFQFPDIIPFPFDTFVQVDGRLFGDSQRIYLDPATGGAWTMQAALAATFGPVFVSSFGTQTIRVSKLRKFAWVEFASRGNAAVRYDTRL